MPAFHPDNQSTPRRIFAGEQLNVAALGGGIFVSQVVGALFEDGEESLSDK